MRQTQRGFAHVGLVVLAVVVLLIGVLGWFVYTQNKLTDPEPNIVPTQEKVEKSENTAINPPTNTTELVEYTDAKWGYKFKYPKTWRLVTGDGDVSIYSPDYVPVLNGISPDKIEKGAKIAITMNARTEYSDSLSDLEYKDVAGYVSSSSVKIAGYDGVEVVRLSEVNSFTVSHFLYRQKSYVSIKYDYINAEVNVNQTVYDGIRNSFSIIE